MDVVHDEHGRGWVWGSGVGRVTVRFETAETPAGPGADVRGDDPALTPWRLASTEAELNEPERDLVARPQLRAPRRSLGRHDARRPGSRPSSGGR